MSSRTRIPSRAISIVHIQNTRLRHNANVREPNSRVRHDCGGVRAMGSDVITSTASPLCLIISDLRHKHYDGIRESRPLQVMTKRKI